MSVHGSKTSVKQSKTTKKLSEARRQSEISHPTPEKAKPKITEPLVLGQYFCMKEMQPRPVTQSFLRAMAVTLIDWVENQEPLSIVEFFRYARVGSGSFHVYLDRCPELKEAHAYALDVLGGRREAGAMRKQLDTAATWKGQYHYGKYYRDAMEYTAKLTKRDDIEDGGGTKIVVIEKYVTDPSMEKHVKKD